MKEASIVMSHFRQGGWWRMEVTGEKRGVRKCGRTMRDLRSI